MNCLVTAGPTFEPLDHVRRLTNFSTGRLGCELASFLTDQGHTVTLLLSQQATWETEPRVAKLERFGPSAELQACCDRWACEPVDAVFHAAAVSDFKFGRVWHQAATGELIPVEGGKLPTRAGRLIAELLPTPKIIARLRTWFPRAWLAGWKYEVDGSRAEALEQARSQLAEHHTNACVANGPAYGEGFGLVVQAGHYLHCPTRLALYTALEPMARAAR